MYRAETSLELMFEIKYICTNVTGFVKYVYKFIITQGCLYAYVHYLHSSKTIQWMDSSMDSYIINYFNITLTHCNLP